ncbi:2-oxoglutarate dehydrogenase N-terminus [Bradyrhizobium erythrophlei]|nr:2-oxoglutarate dehydrogenase N-terminus [Bradyrhizobium erythrophlei]
MDRTRATTSAREYFATTSFLDGANAIYIEQLQDRYHADPNSVDAEWREFFASLEEDIATAGKSADGPSWKRANWPIPVNGELISALDGNWAPNAKPAVDMAASTPPARPASNLDIQQATRDSVRALMMIRAYRMRGHFHANLDPLGLVQPQDHEELHPSTYGFSDADLDRKIFIDGVLGMEFATIREMLDILRRTYCGTIGYEFLHISDPAQKAWIQERVEGQEKLVSTSREEKLVILDKLVEVKGYERYLDKKFVGTKRFGLDGAEATIPALEEILKTGAKLGVRDVVLGMAHRGRLNVLAQVLRKPHRAIFNEFKGGSFVPDEVEGSGDVKYHLGASSDRELEGHAVHLSLTANPSHLEISDPVVLGKVRAKQDQNNDIVERTTALPLLIHGDAAFAGQGVVAECFGLSGLKGYRTGGSLHFIINNQIGFTTDPRYSRSAPYPSDLAKTIDAPIFHANGDDPEAVVHVARIAIEFRQRFHKPVVIDMFCFRLYGHNEGDEPAFTQPLMYKEIRSHKSTLEIYGERLMAEGVVTQADIDKKNADWVAHLDAEFEAGQTYRPNKADWLDGRWTGLKATIEDLDDAGGTGVAVEKLRLIGERITALPYNLKNAVAIRLTGEFGS